jgi:cytochrome c oxidase cbb3-type subunit 3
MTQDHDFDGIVEENNPTPRWLANILWGTLLFSIGYMFHYHVSHLGSSVENTYQEDSKAHKELQALAASQQPPPTEQEWKALLANKDALDKGKQKYTLVCATCHGPLGGGTIGANLTDAYWLHGKGSLQDIFTTVQQGVLEKGMPAWGKILTAEELRHVVAFVGTLRNTHVEGGKAAQGEHITQPATP